MRLIDADALTKKLQHLWNIHDDVDFNNKDVWDELAIAPTIDAVEVVRCRDCKHFELNHWDGPIITAHEICSKWGSGCKTNKDGYCFLGERKTDG